MSFFLMFLRTEVMLICMRARVCVCVLRVFLFNIFYVLLFVIPLHCSFHLSFPSLPLASNSSSTFHFPAGPSSSTSHISFLLYGFVSFLPSCPFSPPNNLFHLPSFLPSLPLSSIPALPVLPTLSKTRSSY